MSGNSGSGPGPVTFVLGIVVILIILGCITAILVNLSPQIQGAGDAQSDARFYAEAATAAVTYPQTIDLEDKRVQNNGAQITDNKNIAWGSGDITFTVASASTASYTLTINSSDGLYGKQDNGQDTVDVSVNGSQSSTLKLAYSCTPSGDHHLDCSTSPITIQLQAGQNSIKVFNQTGWESPNCNDHYGGYLLNGCQSVTSITLANNAGN